MMEKTEKYVLKTSGNCNSAENSADVNIALKANVALKFSSKTISNQNNDALIRISKSLSVRNDNLAKILNSKTFQPLFIDTTGSSSSSGTSSNICDDENVQPQSNNEGDLNYMSVILVV